jgi:hypothetical protein
MNMFYEAIIFKSFSFVSFETFNLFSRQAAEEKHQSSVCAFDKNLINYNLNFTK